MGNPKKLIQIDGTGVVDVVHSPKYHWTVSNSLLARSEVPYIQIREYQQTASSMRQAIKFYASQVERAVKTGKVGEDPYKFLYAVDKSEAGNFYTFPYYSSYHHSIQNAWGENKGTISEPIAAATKFATEIAKTVYPSAGVESAKSWEGSTPASYQFSFQLLNTVDPLNDIKNNKDLINALLHNNLLDKINIISVRPPALCEVRIPGMRETTIAVMSNIFIENMGQINYMGANGAVPDAYNITITIQELLTESRQIFSGDLRGEEGGQVFASLKDIATELSNIVGQ